MIHVSTLSSSAHSFAILGGRNLITYSLSPAFSWEFGQLAVITELNSGIPLLLTETIATGWLNQGEHEWGDLRDKEVTHLNAYGSVLVSEVALSERVPISTPTSIVGKSYKIGSSEVMLAGITPWGTDLTVSGSALAPDMWSSRDERWYMAHERGYSMSVTFHGDVGYYELKKLPYTIETRLWGKLVKSGTYSYPAVSVLCVISRNPAGRTPGVWSSVAVAGKVSASGAITYAMANGHVLSSDVLRSEPAYLLMGPPSVIVTKMNSTAQGLVGVGETFREVCNAIRRDSFMDLPCSLLIFREEDLEFGMLGSDILKQQTYVDSNILLTVYDLLHLKLDVESWVALGKFYTNLSKSLKGVNATLASAKRLSKDVVRNISSQYLGTNYGVMPTVRDIVATTRGVTRLINSEVVIPRRHHARRTFVRAGAYGSTVKQVLTLTVQVPRLSGDFIGNSALPYNQQGIEYLHRWGLWPDFEMLWDFAPFSFVIDWAINFGSLANKADDRTWAQYYPLDYCLLGAKSTWRPRVSSILPYKGVTGDVTFCYYARSVSQTLPLPPIQFDESTGPSSHWAEAGALIVQKRR